MREGYWQIAITFVISVALHGAAFTWLALPSPDPTPPAHDILLTMVVPEIIDDPEPVEPRQAEPPPPVEETPAEPATNPEIPAREVELSLDDLAPAVMAAADVPVRDTQFDFTAEGVVHDPVAAASYEQLIAAWLARHKRYPPAAVRRSIEGECLLKIRIGRDGRLAEAELVSGSGSGLLDRETISMATRANPFPPAPDEVVGPTLEYVIPVRFTIE